MCQGLVAFNSRASLAGKFSAALSTKTRQLCQLTQTPALPPFAFLFP